MLFNVCVCFLPENKDGGGDVLLESDICGEVRNRLQGSIVAVDDDGDNDCVSSLSSRDLHK